jgi:hypothetical protein
MALTQEQINKFDSLTGLDNVSVQKSRANELRSLIPVEKTAGEKAVGVAEKVLDFTGGKELSQGLGQSIAQRGTVKSIEETQKLQFETQGRIITALKERAIAGEDTTELENLLRSATADIQATGQEAEGLLNPNELTNKQVIGDALQLATTAGGAKVAGAVAGKTVQASGIGAGILQGAKTGAIAGAPLGALTGVSQGLQDDKTGKEIIGQGLVGAGTGVLAGGVLGGAIGGVAGGIKGAATRKQDKLTSFVDDLVSPKQTTKVKEQAFREGRVTDQGLLKAAKITPSSRDKQLGESVIEFVDPSKSAGQNLNIIDDKLGEINTGVKAYVKANKVPFNTNQVESQLNAGKDDLKLIFASDKNAEKTYNAVVKEFMKNIKGKDTAGLFEARQKFDKIPAVKKLLDSQGLGENVKKEIVLTVRDRANKYTASLLPEGNKFRDTLLKESKMIEVIQNIAAKNAKEIGKNRLQSLAGKYPVLKLIAAGVAGGASVGVGGALIGSTD